MEERKLILDSFKGGIFGSLRVGSASAEQHTISGIELLTPTLTQDEAGTNPRTVETGEPRLPESYLY